MASTTALARPPFAVDDQDTQYIDRKKLPSLGSRTREERNAVSESSYTAYDTYFDPADSNDDRQQKQQHLAAPSNATGHRPSPSADSAHGAIGEGLFAALAADNSDSDSDDDALPAHRSPAANKPLDSPSMAKSKNQALFEAAVADEKASSAPPPPAYEDTERRARPQPAEKGRDPYPRGPSPNLHPQQRQQYGRGPSPAPSVTPPPPAAPLQVHIPAHQMNAPQPKRPIQPGGPQPGGQYGGPAPLSIVPPGPGAFNGPPGSGGFRGPPGSGGYNGPPGSGGFNGPPMFGGPMPGSPYGSQVFHMNPTPIPTQTSTPIQPAFIKPIKPAFLKSESDDAHEKSSVTSHESSMPIMRGDKEDTLPLRSGPRIPRVGQQPQGGQGDDFWRRFSMVVKTERAKPAEQKKSDWLKSNARGGRSMTRLVWCIGVFLLLCIIGGSVTAWWFSRNNAAHQIPVAIGGGAQETMTNTSVENPTPVAASTNAATKTSKSAATTSSAAKRNVDVVEGLKMRSVGGDAEPLKRHTEFVSPESEVSERDVSYAKGRESHRRRRHTTGLGSSSSMSDRNLEQKRSQ